MQKSILKFSFYITGAVLLALGVQFAILSRLGAGAYDALNYNLSVFLTKYLKTNISLGTAMFMTMVLLFTIAMILKPRLEYLLGFLLAAFIGLMIDLFSKIIPPVNSFPIQVLYYILGILAIAFGVALIIRSKMPMTPMDNLMMIVVQKTKKPVALIKTLLEALYALIAIILGYLSGIAFGAVSLGTIVMTLLMGPTINLFLKVVKPIKKA
ncbi:MAG TPA: hypothetical protein GX692_03655 [Acholeplasmataceae bacterium]|jgi:uncharacterized membrane protein YczE|nr:hypothetical protein [Acholeplasmataceae bacterium]